jgi:myo-inositol-1(or 4)-monophosphatase
MASAEARPIREYGSPPTRRDFATLLSTLDRPGPRQPLGDVPERFIALAHRIADAARAETLVRWRQDNIVRDKSGGAAWDPVTDADVAAERAMRSVLESEVPDHAISGEELPDRPGEGPWRWSLDPIDGTRSFVCGLPSWVTLIALLEDGQPVLGLIDAPALDERYVGCERATFTRKGDESPLRTSGCTLLRETRLSTTDPYLLGESVDVWERLRRCVRTTRYGLDGYGYARLAAGSLDLIIESGLSPHDFNALIPVIRAAGGAIGDWNGGNDFSQGKIVAAASPALYEAAIEAMR